MASTHNHEQNPKDEVRFWQKNQVILTFRTSLDSREPANNKENIINQLPFDQIDELLTKPTKEGQKALALRNFGPGDVPQKRGGLSLSLDSSNKGLNDPVGKNLFSLEDGQQSVITASFHIDDFSPNKGEGPEPDNTIEAIERINEDRSKYITGNVLSLSAAPNWYVSSTGDVTHGCPITPPVPFDGSTVCQSDPGYYPITVPQLTPELQSKEGEGVTVFVLDTFPEPDKVIYPALEKVKTGGNKLLVDVAKGMIELEAPFTPASMATDMAKLPAINYCYQSLSYDAVAIKDQPKTGKDIDGKLVGYPMADHGLFVAGIIRSLAHRATIICIRVLNDFGVGDIGNLNDVLEYIVMYVQNEKDRHQHDQNYCPRFVINLSSVATPYDEELPGLGLSGKLTPISREELRVPLQALAEQGVIVVAAAGNDSDPRQPMHRMGKHGAHLDSRYPAAFEDTIQQVISVGSVDKNGHAANYSNCPGDFGVATFGGGILERDTSGPATGRTQALRPDALLGLYTTPYYPALAKNDDIRSEKAPAKLEYPTKDAPDNKAWAYWSGTSFSTPIITALTARILQTATTPGIDVRKRVIDLAGGKTVAWPGHHAAIPVVHAKQCGN